MTLLQSKNDPIGRNCSNERQPSRFLHEKRCVVCCLHRSPRMRTAASPPFRPSSELHRTAGGASPSIARAPQEAATAQTAAKTTAATRLRRVGTIVLAPLSSSSAEGPGAGAGALEPTVAVLAPSGASTSSSNTS